MVRTDGTMRYRLKAVCGVPESRLEAIYRRSVSLPDGMSRRHFSGYGWSGRAVYADDRFSGFAIDDRQPDDLWVLDGGISPPST